MPKTRAPLTPPSSKVKFSNVDKVFFPDGKFTKGDMLQYYSDVAEWILPHLKNRPVTLIRFPDGRLGQSFYEKNAPKFTPSWVKTTQVARNKHAGSINYVLINDVSTLMWCANLASIELHPFLHLVKDLDCPTFVAFDLDPGEGSDLLTCIEVAQHVRALMTGLGLEVFPKVSGSKGLQLYVPLNTKVSYELTSPFAKAVAQMLEQKHPELVVSKMSKELRKGKVMIDWSQNNPSKTTVSVYSMRAKRDTPYISMPVTWDELKKAGKSKNLEPLFFTPDQAIKRLKRVGDLFAPVLTLKQKLPAAFRGQDVDQIQGRLTGDAADEPSEPEPNADKKSSAPKKISAKSEATTGKAPAGTKRASKSAGSESTAEESSSKKATGTKASAAAALRAYEKKRDFTQTKEPSGKETEAETPATGEALRFVIQKHAATNLHYDFRLEMDGTLKSWAVPKGVPYEIGVKRSAFQVEDHPIDYMRFEGTIPKGQYGGGTVMVWDIGTYTINKGSYDKGSLHLTLSGKKLKGDWHIFRIRSDDAKPVWLLTKEGEAMTPLSERDDDSSALSRRSMARIAEDNDAQWQSNQTHS